MVRRSAFRWTLATLALLAAKSASADPITFTGNVAQDFSLTASGGSTNSDVRNITQTQLFPNPAIQDPLNRIAEPSIMTSNGIVTGWAIKDIATAYDKNTDTLYVGLQTYTIAGNSTGTGAANLENYLTSKHFLNPASFGVNGPLNPNGTPYSDKSITLAFAGLNPSNNSQPGPIVALAGVPAMKPAAGTPGYGTDNFTVAKFVNNGLGIQNSYGAPLLNNVGNLAFDPSASHPHFEFTIKNFSTVSSSLNPTKGFWLQMYGGSGQDGPIGEESTQFVRVPGFPQQQNIPEPTTWLAWTLIVGGAAVRAGRRQK